MRDDETRKDLAFVSKADFSNGEQSSLSRFYAVYQSNGGTMCLLIAVFIALWFLFSSLSLLPKFFSFIWVINFRERNESTTILAAIKDEVFASMLIMSQIQVTGNVSPNETYTVYSQHILLCILYRYIVSILHRMEILFLRFQAPNPVLKIIFSSINSLQVPVNRNILKSRQYEKLNVIEMGTEFSE